MSRVDRADVAPAAERHRDVDLLADDLERAGDPGSAAGAEAVEEGAADVGALGAERQRLQHVLAGADAAVEVHLDAVADRVDDGGQRRIVEGAPSSCRPPWLETMMASAPVSAAMRASSGSRMPFRISLPPQRSLIQATSFQDRRGSNCSLVQAASEARSPTSVDVADDVAEGAALGAEHVEAQRAGWRSGRVLRRQPRRRRQAVAEVLVALAEDLQVERQDQRRAVRRLGALDQVAATKSRSRMT